MVDAIVSLAIERITGFLIQEASFLSGVEAEISRLQNELKRMHCFLKDADGKQQQDERVRNWISDVRSVAYDSEDIIDTFILKIALKEGGSCQLIAKLATLLPKVSDMHQVGNQIESIRTRSADISASMQTYGIKFDPEGEVHQMQNRHRRSYPHDEEEHVVSFEAITRDVKAELMGEDERLRVVSIVGMGGLGKTTLAKKIYNDIHVRQHFDCCSWAFISQQFSPKDVLTGILVRVASPQDKQKLEQGKLSKLEMKDMPQVLEYRAGPPLTTGNSFYMQPSTNEPFPYLLPPSSSTGHLSFPATFINSAPSQPGYRFLLDNMKEEELVETLYQVLREKRYLVVLDDIWKTEAWDSLKHAFPNGKKGSRILFTTRNREVASYADPWSTPLEPSLLSNDQGWELLSKKAFPRDVVAKQGWQPEYEMLGREMVKKCEGLPLAVAVIGGLLATKKSVKEWKMVQRNINAQFAKLQKDDEYGVHGILALSYHSFPLHLKPCFLYLSQFPEDWQIRKKKLIRMWIAEGFVMQSGDETMEDIAEQYLEELVSRCMVQVSKPDHTGTGIKVFRMHDLVRDMCILKAKEENFIEVFDDCRVLTEAGNSIFRATSQSRRVAVHARPTGNGSLPLPEKDNKIRSLLYHVEKNTYGMERKQSVYTFRRFKLLRVLNIENVTLYCGHIPREIGSLIHLRYLGLRGTELADTKMYLCYRRPALPATIGCLRNLLTLDLRFVAVKIPDVIWKLQCLRHLLVEDSNSGPLRLDTLRNLKTLKRVNARSLVRKGAVLQMAKLRNLAVEFQGPEEAEVVLNSPSIVTGQLRSLNMKISYGSSFPSLEALSGCQDLTKAVITGKISENVGSHSHSLEFLPASLTKLILWGSEISEDPMPILEKLHNLRNLSLQEDAYSGTEMACSAGGFSRLEILRLGVLKVREWRIEDGAMPYLRSLNIWGLRRLTRIPQGLKFVAALEELKLNYMGDEFNRRIKIVDGIEGEDLDCVRHIPSISFDE